MSIGKLSLKHFLLYQSAMMEFIHTLSLFADQWLGTALPKLFLLFLGILLCILVVAAIWDRRIKTLSAGFGMSLGIFLASIALGETISALLGSLDVSLRIRLVAVSASIAMLVLTLVAFVKTGLRPRYALLWTVISLLVLLTALFPGPLRSFPSILGMQYAPAIVTLSLLFLLLLVFHFSITISELQGRQHYLSDRLQALEREVFGSRVRENRGAFVTKQGVVEVFLSKISARQFWQLFTWKPPHGTSLTAPVIILLAVTAVFITGMTTPQVMIGDEVTHYYMMQTQVGKLPSPNFFAEIPTGWGGVEVRRYPHSFLWHYLGALLFFASGGSFAVIQLYQACFLGQLLGVAYLLARTRKGVETRSALVYLLLLASLPLTLIFSVAFYQDVPMTAQIITAFYLLRKRRWLSASLFLCFALALKVTAILFYPMFFICLLVWTYNHNSAKKTGLILVFSVFLVGSFTFGFGKIINQYAHSPFYPVAKAEQVVRQLVRYFDINRSTSIYMETGKREQEANGSGVEVVSEQSAEIIANHPGDLRVTSNFLIYGGLLLWLVIGGAIAAAFYQAFGKHRSLLSPESAVWLWGTGGAYLLLVAWFLRSAPDARFFFPGLVFCLLPISERIVCLPRPRWIVMLITVLALMQGGYTLSKINQLRRVTPEIQEAIHYLEKNQPEPRTVFMYPEGNYRLFPVPHEWYLRYHLREFWQSANDERIAILQQFNIGAIVVKKYLVAPVDAEITNLGVYPDYFVRELKNDSRFHKVFENRDVAIYQVPTVKKQG